MATASERKCLFCGSGENLTKEHVFPQWIWRLYHAKPESNRYTVNSTATKRKAVKRKASTLDMQVRVACSDCNNGWMSRLEKEIAKPALTSFIRHGEKAKTISDSEEVGLISWAMKMAYVLDFTAASEQRHYDDAQRQSFVETFTPPEGASIWIANYLPDRNRRAHTSVTNLTLRPKDSPDAVYRGQVSTFAIGKIAFQVLHVFVPDGAAAFDWRLATADRPEKASIQIWPQTGETLTWPPEEYFDDQALNDFANRFGAAAATEAETLQSKT